MPVNRVKQGDGKWVALTIVVVLSPLAIMYFGPIRSQRKLAAEIARQETQSRAAEADALRSASAAEASIVWIDAVAVAGPMSDTLGRINGQPIAEIALTVIPKDREPFKAKGRKLITPINAPQYQPGKRLAVKYDQANQERVSIVGPLP